MAYYEHRQHSFRGRGGGGHGNFRKRRFRDDDDNDRRPQRRKFEEPAHVKLRRGLLSLAESTNRRPEDEILDLTKLVDTNLDNEELRRVFLSVVIQLVLEQPLKIPYLATLLLSINENASSLVAEVIKLAGDTLNSYLSTGSWREVKLLLRLLACLQLLWDNEEGVFPILEQLFSRVVDLQTASSEDGLGLELVKIILLTMAYAMAARPTQSDSQARSLLEKTDIVASAPHSLESLVTPFLPGGQPAPGKSVIGLLQAQMQSELNNGWPLKCIPKPKSLSQNSEVTINEPKHAFPYIAIPSPVVTNTRPLLPEIYFSIYNGSEVETVPSADSIASSIIRDSIIDTINILDFNRNAAAKCLIDVDQYFTLGTFIDRATPFDRLREGAAGGSTWKPEDVAVEAVFSQLFKLPEPEHKLIYYHAILTEVCKLAPSAIAPSLGRAIRFLYRGLDSMDLELHHRFMDWFAHHLSNFGFTWKWTEWVDDVDLSHTSSHKAFIVGALEKEIRLSFAQRIRGTLPEAYHSLVSEEKEKDTPNFKYSNPAYPYSTQAREVVRLIKIKAPDSELEEQLANIQDAAVEIEGVEPVLQSTDAFVTALCYVGSKSLSHILNGIERYKDRLSNIGSLGDVARHQIITSVLDYWKEKPGNGINIIDKFLNYSILTPASVVEWVFVLNMRGGEILTQPATYEMVTRTLFKVSNRLRQLVTARLQEGLSADQAELTDSSIIKESAQMKQLFSMVEDAARGIAEGSADGIVEDDNKTTEHVTDLRCWGQKWLLVFSRKFAIEDAWVRESLASAKLATDVSADGNGGKLPLPTTEIYEAGKSS